MNEKEIEQQLAEIKARLDKIIELLKQLGVR